MESGRVSVLKYVTRVAGIERFREESALLRRIDSPHVARWFGHFENDDHTAAAIEMEAVDGVPLRAVLDSRGPLEPESALLLFSGALRGLADAHALGVLHRDYKPANVVVRTDGVSKLIDFGVAALVGSPGARVGTPAYMAPEQWEAAPPSPATDVYAATCVFYECFTGEPPYGRAAAALPERHMSAPIPAEAVLPASADRAGPGQTSGRPAADRGGVPRRTRGRGRPPLRI